MTEHDDLDTGMDDRLHAAGAQWRASVPPAADPVLPADERARRRWVVPVAAAAAAVAAIAGTSLALSNERGPDPAPPVASEPTSGPTSGPTSEPTGGPTSEPAGDHTTVPPNEVAACAPGDLVAGEPMTEGAAGTMVTYFDLTLAPGAAPCTIEGYPEVAFLDHGRDLGLQPTRNTAWPPAPVRIDRGATANVTIGWAVHHHCGDVDNDQLRVTLPGGQVVVVPGFGPSSCDPGEQTSVPWVGAVTTK